MPLSKIQAKSKKELIEKIMSEMLTEGASEAEVKQAYAVAIKEAEKRGFADAMMTMGYSEYTARVENTPKEVNDKWEFPVTLAAEMVQKYHRKEIPFMDKHLPPNVTFIKVFKPYDELAKAIEELEDRGGTLPFVMPHSKGTFLKDQCPKEYQQYMKDFIDYPEVKGFIKDGFACEKNRKIKGTLVLSKDVADQQFLNDIRSGKVINVSIGFICDWDGGGVFNGEEYTLTQRNIVLGHLAGLIDARGKCPSGICGINQDHHTEHIYQHLTTHPVIMSDVDFNTENTYQNEDGIETDPTPIASPTDLQKGSFKYDTPHTQDNRKGEDQMTLEEQIKALQAQLMAVQDENKALKDAEATSKVAEAHAKIGKLEVQVGTLTTELTKAKQEAADAKAAAKIAVEEHEKQQKVFTDLSKFGYAKDKEVPIGSKKIKVGDMSMEQLEIVLATLNDQADKLLIENGLPNKPSQADRDRKLNPNADNHKSDEDFPVSCGADAESIADAYKDAK